MEHRLVAYTAVCIYVAYMSRGKNLCTFQGNLLFPNLILGSVFSDSTTSRFFYRDSHYCLTDLFTLLYKYEIL